MRIVSDCNPVYYGLSFPSAGKGNITHAFATEEDAREYAYNYEKGTVEQQEDGSYRYTGSFIVRQKTKFESNWDLTDAIYYFAGKAVEKHYFDMSDKYTYLTLSPEILEANPNLRQMELPRSIKILAEEQKDKLSDIEALPLLNDKHFAYLDPETGEVNEGEFPFEFVMDQYGGLDSKSVTITDSKGVLHEIAYSESVGKQLQEDGCPSGIVTIREETMYGDSCEYQAVYIAPEENQTNLTLSLKRGEESDTVVFQGSNEGPDIEADSFAITGLQDPLDPYALLIVKHRQHEDFYTAKDNEIDAVWSEPGHYTVTCVNRMGYGYTVSINLGGVEETADDASFKPEDVALPDYSATTVNGDTMNKQPTQLPAQSKDDASASVSKNPGETENQEKGRGSNGSWLIFVGIIAALGMIMSVLAYRIKLFSRARKELKREEDNKHD